MKRLDELLPNGAQQYFDWVREQTAHRQRLESERLASQIATEKRGQLFGLSIALGFGAAALIIGILCILLNSFAAIGLAISFVGFPVAGIVSVFVTGRIIGKKENIEKTKILAGRAPEQE